MKTDRQLKRLVEMGTPSRHIINDAVNKRWIVRSGGSFAGRFADPRRGVAHGIPRRAGRSA